MKFHISEENPRKGKTLPASANTEPVLQTERHKENIICQVEGCENSLKTDKEYYQRHRICVNHAKASQVSVEGKTQRFCQQCSRFHCLDLFDQERRSCRQRLIDHKKRRRKNDPDLEWKDGRGGEHQGTGFTFEEEGIRVKSVNLPPKQQQQQQQQQPSLSTAPSALERRLFLASIQSRGHPSSAPSRSSPVLSDAELAVLLPNRANSPALEDMTYAAATDLLSQASRLQNAAREAAAAGRAATGERRDQGLGQQPSREAEDDTEAAEAVGRLNAPSSMVMAGNALQTSPPSSAPSTFSAQSEKGALRADSSQVPVKQALLSETHTQRTGSAQGAPAQNRKLPRGAETQTQGESWMSLVAEEHTSSQTSVEEGPEGNGRDFRTEKRASHVEDQGSLWYKSQERTVRLSFRKLGSDCSLFPSDMEWQVGEWLQRRPSAVDIQVGPRNEVLSAFLRMSVVVWSQVLSDPQANLEKFIHLNPDPFWREGPFLINLEAHSFFLRDGELHDLSLGQKRPSPVLSYVMPFCTVTGESSLLHLVGSWLHDPDSQVGWVEKGEPQVRACQPVGRRCSQDGLAVQQAAVLLTPLDASPAGRVFLEVEHLVGFGKSRPWPLLVAGSDVAAEIRTLEGLTSGAGGEDRVGDVLSTLHDLGWAFEALRRHRQREAEEREGRVGDGDEVTEEGDRKWPAEEGIQDSSLEALIALSVGRGWWATSRLLLDLAVARQKKKKAKEQNKTIKVENDSGM